MTKSDRVYATLLAVIVWLAAGYAVASRPVALQAITPPALDVPAGSWSGTLFGNP